VQLTYVPLNGWAVQGAPLDGWPADKTAAPGPYPPGYDNTCRSVLRLLSCMQMLLPAGNCLAGLWAVMHALTGMHVLAPWLPTSCCAWVDVHG
jgi:hypothetical protein